MSLSSAGLSRKGMEAEATVWRVSKLGQLPFDRIWFSRRENIDSSSEIQVQ